MNERIKELRLALGLTQEEFANRIHLSQNYIWLIEKGERTPSERTVNDICNEFAVNKEWLIFGEGEMSVNIDKEKQISNLLMSIMNVTENSSPEDKLKRNIIDIIANLPPEVWAKLTEVAKQIKKEQGE